MSDRLSRKEIKRDEFAEAVQRGTEAVQQNWTLIATVAGALLLLVLGVFGYRAYSASQQAKAGEALNGALKVYSAPIDTAAAQPDDATAPTFASREARAERATTMFAEVADNHGGTSAGAVAHAYLGRLAAQAGSLDEARKHWNEYLDSEPDGLMATNLRLDLMRLDLDEGKGEEVATRLEEMLASAEKELPEDVILFQLASARETLGLEGEALTAYQRLVDEHPSSPYSVAARQKVSTLGAGDATPMAF